MNLQQLNQSGQNVWSFVVTAIVSLLVTAFFWFTLELYNSVVDYKRKSKEHLPWRDVHEPRRGIAFQVAMYLGLIGRDRRLILFNNVSTYIIQLTHNDNRRTSIEDIYWEAGIRAEILIAL